jgi:CubicO group peptidase (beta-lactamase class C family)
MKRRMKRHQVPGAALAVWDANHHDLYMAGFGVTSVEADGQPVRSDTLFRIGSITKPLTALLILRLVQSGLLDLDQPVTDYLPWLVFSNPTYGAAITLRQLLSHTAGLPSSYYPFGKRNPEDLETYIRQSLPHYEFVAPPQMAYAYSNVGFRLAGFVAQAVTGVFYPDLMQREVFDPLGMERTTFDPTIAMTYRVALSHDLDEGGQLRVQHRFGDNAMTYPSGGAISCVGDLLKVAQMLLQEGVGEGGRYLEARWVAEMQTPQAERYSSNLGSYGLGLELQPGRGQPVCWHDGLTGTFTARLAIAPHQKRAFVLCNNRGFAFWDTMDTVMRQAFQLFPDLPKSSSKAAESAEIEGYFLGAERGLLHLYKEDSRWVASWNGQRYEKLQALRSDLYQQGDLTLGIIGPDWVSINSFPCCRIAALTPPSEPNLSLYCGVYNGPDRLTIRLVGGELQVYSEENAQESPAIVIGVGRLACHFGTLTFDEGRQNVLLGTTYRLQKG